MRQVRAHHEERLRAAPEPGEDFGYLFGRRIADHERHQGKRSQHRLQERKLDFERMLRPMRGIGFAHARQIGDGCQRLLVHRDAAERGLESARGRCGDAAQPHVVRRPDQHHALDRFRLASQRGERGRRYPAGIDVAGVRRDQRLRRAGMPGRVGQERADLRPKPPRIPGIERARHGRGPYLGRLRCRSHCFAAMPCPDISSIIPSPRGSFQDGSIPCRRPGPLLAQARGRPHPVRSLPALLPAP